MRKEFEMSESDLSALLDACRPTPTMYLSGGIPMSNSPQENANLAWATLGKKLGFDGMTVEPVSGKGQRFFTAEERLVMVTEADVVAALEECEDKPREQPVNFIAATKILDRAHQALREIDAADQTQPIPAKQLNAVWDAVEAIEEFCRDRGIVLSEFQKIKDRT